MNPSDKEIAVLESIAKGRSGKTLILYLKRIQDSLCDIRNIPEGKLEAHKIASDVIQEQLIDKLTVLSGEYNEPDGTEWK